MTAVIYARYSSDSQREASIEGQLRDCKDYAEKNGITVVGTYIDRAYSAKTDDRPDFQRMIKDSAKSPLKVRFGNVRLMQRRTASPWSAPTLTVPTLPKRMTAQTFSG